MLTITPAAGEAVRELRVANDLPDDAGLRVTARLEGDEVGIELDFVDRPEDDDEVVEGSGARVFLDPESADLLSGVELDVEEHGDHVHFQFAPRADDGGGDPV